MAKEHDCPIESGKLKPTDVKCPVCRKGVLAPGRGRFGVIWKCDADSKPRCKFYTETKPTGKKCSFVRDHGKKCGALMVEGTKTIPDRCSEKTCPNRNPHKLAKNAS